jgi:hypothetical protein
MKPQKNPTTSHSKRARAIKRPGVMNRFETRYSEHLQARQDVGEILRFDYEPEKFKLAKATFYTPDFRVVTAEGYIEFHECKGFWRQSGRIKIKCASDIHPMYKWIAVQWKDKTWVFEPIGNY